jgi:hypothetical protein
MLEAFKASSDEIDSSTEERAPSSPSSAPAPARRSKPSGGLPDVAPELFAVVLGVLVVGSFFLGRWSVSTSVQAAGVKSTLSSGTSEAPASIDASRGSERSVPEAREAEVVMDVSTPQPAREGRGGAPLSTLELNHEAFIDPANTMTIRVIYYTDDKDGQAKAFETATYLGDLGFPAMIPVRKGGHVFVCVGAAPKKDDPELLRIQRELRLVVGPPPSSNSGDFESAYVYNIDKLIQR